MRIYARYLVDRWIETGKAAAQLYNSTMSAKESLAKQETLNDSESSETGGHPNISVHDGCIPSSSAESTS